MACPSAQIFSTNLLLETIFLPMQKNVAFASNFAKHSKTKSVISGVGPSSKVKYTSFESTSLAIFQVKLGKTLGMNEGI
jgi:hypothetical protein